MNFSFLNLLTEYKKSVLSGSFTFFFNKGFLSLVFLLLFVNVSTSQNYNSTNSGNWGDAGNWDIGVSPSHNTTTSGDIIRVSTNITLNGDLTVSANATLIVSGCDTLSVIGNVQFNNNSTVIVEPCAVLIVDGSVTNNNNSDDITIDGTIQIAGDYTGGNGSELNGLGNMDIDGSITTSGSGSVYGSTDDCTVDCDNSGMSPLPVELVEFSAKQSETMIEVSWSTASETNCDSYIIESSIDGINFDYLGELQGAGNTNAYSSYLIIDKTPTPGTNYYRLTQYDFDGKDYDKGISSVEFVSSDVSNIYPNPINVGASIKVDIQLDQSAIIYFELVSINGKVVYQRSLSSIKGNIQVELDLSTNIPPGLYFLKISYNGILNKQKLVIQG